MNKSIFRNRWIEITKGWDFSYKVSQYHDRYTLIISLVYMTLFITLPNLGYDFNNWDRSWGVYWYGSAIWFCWGKETKSVDMPWSWTHVRCSVLKPDNTWGPYLPEWEGKNDGRFKETHPYKYTLKNGHTQERLATVYTEEREWRWKWFTWLRWPRKIRRSIDIAFNGEVGERSGSWKGGTIGCGYEVILGETQLDTLRRMERDRIFK